MSRDDYYCTYELNAKRDLLLRLVICIIMTNRREIMKMLHMHMGILILFEVDDNKSKHYDEYKEIMTEILKGYAANQESYPYIKECGSIAEKYSKRLKISRAAEIAVLPVPDDDVAKVFTYYKMLQKYKKMVKLIPERTKYFQEKVDYWTKQLQDLPNSDSIMKKYNISLHDEPIDQPIL